MKTIIFIAVMLISHAAAARECDPIAILSHNSDTSIRDHEVGFIFAKRTANKTRSTKSSSLGFAIPGVPSDVSLESARAVASLVESSTDINYSDKEYDFLVKQYLSDNAVEAWKECLDNQELVIESLKNSVTESDFFVTVDWRSKALSGNSALLTIRAINGSFGCSEEKKKDEILIQISRGKHTERLCDRDTSKKTEIRFEISNGAGKISDGIFIPPHITYNFTAQILRSEPAAVKGTSNGTAEVTRCITKTGGVLLRDTARWSEINRESGAKSYVDEDNNTPVQVCGGLKATGGQAKIRGTLTVTEMFVRVRKGGECDCSGP